VLSDGTKVWINAESALKFPPAFTGHERTVELTGEAYFEVAGNADKPFHVIVNGMQVQVLGTSFNVMAYPDESVVRTTLLEGAVRLTQGNHSRLLQPRQQGIVNNKGITVVDADTDEAIAWKNGYFEFNRSDIRDIMRQLSRWYDTEVIYESKVPDDEFVGKISRDAKLSQVLHILQLSNVHFRIENRKIVVTP
jgi:transmembrane sensor